MQSIDQQRGPSAVSPTILAAQQRLASQRIDTTSKTGRKSKRTPAQQMADLQEKLAKIQERADLGALKDDPRLEWASKILETLASENQNFARGFDAKGVQSYTVRKLSYRLKAEALQAEENYSSHLKEASKNLKALVLKSSAEAAKFLLANDEDSAEQSRIEFQKNYDSEFSTHRRSRAEYLFLKEQVESFQLDPHSWIRSNPNYIQKGTFGV
jgi:hypothetical protein